MLNIKKINRKDSLIMIALVLVVSVLGISFGFLSYQENTNEVNFSTGELSFSTGGTLAKTYSTVTTNSGISDVEGNSDYYIDFSVTAINSNANGNLYYTVILNEASGLTSPVDDTYVRFALYDIDNSSYIFNNGNATDLTNLTIYTDSFGECNLSTTKNYRLYVWVDSSLTDATGLSAGVTLTIQSSTKRVTDVDYSTWNS